MSLFDELKRRKVIRVGIAYLAVAWLLLQVAETLLPAYGYTDAAIRNLVAILAVGFLVSLVLTWIFDWTSHGVEVTASVDERQAASAAASTRAPNSVIAAVVLLALVAAAWLTWRSLAGVPRTERTIAVLPFATLGLENADVFTDGMHLGVLTRLSEIHELDVISRTSVLRFRDSQMSLPAIADQLGANWVLNAEVQQGNEEVLVSVSLADARKDRQVWAENYRRTLTATNLFQIQAEIARRIIDQIKAKLTEQEANRLALVPTEDLDAYRFYQLGRLKLEARGRDDMWAAVDLFGEALEYDPNYALAHAGTADALASLVAYGHESGPEIMARAAAAVDRALQLDAGLAEAWAASALLAYLRRDLPGAFGDIERAIEARPSYARAHAINAYNHGLADDPDAALESARRAVALDPLSPEAVTNFSSSNMVKGHRDTALSEAQRLLELAPGWPNTRFVNGLIQFELRHYREAAVELRDLAIPWVGMGAETMLALSLHALGQEDQATALMQIVAASDDVYALATLTAAFGDLDGGYRQLEALKTWPDWPTLAFTNHHTHIWNPHGNDPRYAATRRQIDESWGLLPEPALSASSEKLQNLIAQNHRAYLPSGNEPFPAVLVIPGCSGVALESSEAEAAIPQLTQGDLLFRAHYPKFARRLSNVGFAVYLIDILSSEEKVTSCGDTVAAQRIAQYIDASIAWVRIKPSVNPMEIHIVGFSMGGKGVLAWLHRQPREASPIQSVTVVYPQCRNRGPLNMAVPLLMLLGDADDIANPLLCDQLVESSPTKNLITVRHYPGARHGFDIEDAPHELDIGNGKTLGYQKAAADRAWAELTEFVGLMP